LIRRENGVDSALKVQDVSPEVVYLQVRAKGQDYQFYVADHPDQWQAFGNPIDGRVLSTEVAGGFTGAYMGMYASSNGNSSDNYADFDWFEYKGQ
jgi:alpha-N-arabinofuranosidase